MPTFRTDIPMPLDLSNAGLDSEDWTLDGQAIRWSYTTATSNDGPYGSLGTDIDRGVSVIKEDGTWVQVQTPTAARIAAAEGFLEGGYEHTITPTTKTELDTDGVGGTAT